MYSAGWCLSARPYTSVVSEAATLDVIVTVSAVAPLVLCPRLATGRGEPAVSRGPAGRLVGHPAVWLAIVTGLIYLNQVLFTVYVLRVRHGDPSFIARYLPSGWFTLVRGGAIMTLAGHFPGPGLLAPTVLRVQAFLELPFVIFGYLTACRWFGVFDRARRLVWPASIAWTATFCLIEWSLRNPFTGDDLVLRAAAAILVPVWAARLPAACDEGPGHGPFGLLVASLSVAALGGLILVVYDTALLYNLGKLAGELPVAGLAAAALVVARAAAGRLPARPPGRGVASIGSSFGWFLVLFFVPALPVRYGIDSGTRSVAELAGLVLLVAACVRGVRDVLAGFPGPRGAWLAQMAVATIAGLAVGIPVAMVTRGYPEARLLIAAASFFTVAVVVCAIIDAAGQSRDRTKAYAEMD